jgi:hypothetical protein
LCSAVLEGQAYQAEKLCADASAKKFIALLQKTNATLLWDWDLAS